MAQSESINELAAALSKAQGKFGHIMKNKEVHFGQTNYAYAELADAFDACREALAENGLSIVQPMQFMGNSWVVITKLMHSSGQWIDSMLPINIEGKPQDVGSRITYMRKYQLWSILALATEDDDGQSEAKRKHEESLKQKELSESQKEKKKPDPTNEKISLIDIGAIAGLLNQLDNESTLSFMQWIEKTFNVTKISDLPQNAVDKCKASLNAKIKYLNDKKVA